MSVDFNALDVDKPQPVNSFLSHGHLFLKNTVENFRNTDKKLLLREIGTKVNEQHWFKVFHEKITVIVSDLV